MAPGLILLAGLLLGDGQPAGQETILWLGAQAPTDLDQAALLQAVAVYTRDLRLSVRAIAETRIAPTPAGAARAVALLRAGAARLAFWCEGTAATGEVVLYTVDAKGTFEAHAIEGISVAGPELYRAIALKLRSVVADTEAPAAPAGSEIAAARPAPATPENIASVGAPEARAPSRPSQAPVAPAASRAGATAASAVAVVAAQAPPPSPVRSRLSGAIGYRLVVPAGNAPLRQALGLEGGWAVARVVELSLGAELAPAAGGHVASGSVSLFDVPLRAGARLVRRRPRLWLAAGAFAGLHLLSARATASSGAEATTFTATTSAGVEVSLRAPLGHAVAGELRVFGEEIVPRTVFWVGGTRAIELGPQLGLGLGLAFAGP